MKNIKYTKFSIFAFLLVFLSCTNLEEDVLDESLTGTGQAETVSGSIAPAYGLLRNVWLHTRNFGLQEIASDEAILPYRGGRDWFDGGKFIAIHQHLTTPGNALVGDTWTDLTLTLSRAVAAEERLKPEAVSGDAEAQNALYEMIAMKAYLNMLILDNWGIVFKKSNAAERSEILKGQNAIDYIESELLSIVNTISNDNGPGRFSRDAVKALMARLYLNAAVYRDPYGTPDFKSEDMQKVIQYTNEIIAGSYSLSPEYFALFNDDNNTNPEIIFSLDQRGVLQNEHSRWAYWSISGDLVPRPEWPNSR
ncbi:MAG TPA: RagB/SusD family nutrient uptake outer membrane protein, partial [Cyclobacteriaceae bacterium]|nr:RagB/SusD family nutrient uptake outer membrane protein [Cyclobacteriaceae bacterium]